MAQPGVLTQQSQLPTGPISHHYLENDKRHAAIRDGCSQIDEEKLKRRYDEEREKRLRSNPGPEQYRAYDGALSSALRDPFIHEKMKRQPITNSSSDVLIIGGGFGAQLMAVELLKAGIKDLLMVEKAGDFGGAWYWNRYPGIQCDIESYVYVPLLEETGYLPTRKYTGGQELRDHARRIGSHFGLYDKALFQTEVKSLHWNDDLCRWTAKTSRGDILTSRFVVSAIGPLHRPKAPALKGLGDFKGTSFHTSRWDYEYTGGAATPSPSLVNLANKRVGVIGTGATAVQIVPHLGRWAEKLYVFQRTPSSVDHRGNLDTDPSFAATLKPGWQRKRMDNFNVIMNGGTQDVDLVSDGWTDSLRRLSLKRLGSDLSLPPRELLERRQRLDFEKMEEIRNRVDQFVKDPTTAESLKPYYNQFCKRPCFHDEYLQTFNRPNVSLVDTQGKGVTAITEKGVVANGQEHELDCLIFATGFETSTSWTQRSGIDVFGREGRPLVEKWQDGPSTLHGHSTRGFPNCFFLQITQAANSPNFLHVSHYQAANISYIIRRCIDDNVRTVEPTQAAEDAWVKTIVDSRETGRSFREQCTPGYYNNEGVRSAALDKQTSFAGGSVEFIRLLDEWRERGDLRGLERCV